MVITISELPHTSNDTFWRSYAFVICNQVRLDALNLAGLPKQNRMAGHFHQSHSTGHWPQSSTAYFSGRHSGNVQTVWNLHMTPRLSFVVHVYVCRLESKPPYWINRSTNAERCQFEKQYGRDRAPVDCHVKRTYCFGDIKSNQK